MGTKSNPSKFDCYAAADPDEPMFVLLGRDPMAPLLVKLWAAMREYAGEDPKKCDEARACALDMQEWAVRLGKTPARERDLARFVLERMGLRFDLAL